MNPDPQAITKEDLQEAAASLNKAIEADTP
jgi:hypothetical protein